MVNTVAVVAHFDPHDVTQARLCELVHLLRDHGHSVVIVSRTVTGVLMPSVQGVHFLLRPDIGGDLYSYGVGLVYALEHLRPEGVLLMDSSFHDLDASVCVALLEQIKLKVGCAGAVFLSSGKDSNLKNLLSFLLLGRDVISSEEFCSEFIRFASCLRCGDALHEKTLLGMLRGHHISHVCSNFAAAESLNDGRTERETSAGVLSFGAGVPGYRFLQVGHLRRRGVRVAVVLHLFYVDLLEEIIAYLRFITEPFDLYVTTPHELDIPVILEQCQGVASAMRLHVTENRGRDIGPFVKVYREGLLDSYQAVLKLHSKKSKYSERGEVWRHFLLQELIGSSRRFLKVMKVFSEDKVGIIGPHKYYLTDSGFWGSNKAAVLALMQAAFGDDDGARELGFFGGSMFWFRPEAFAPIKLIGDSVLSFPVEDGSQDGTTAHALERFFCPMVRRSGFKSSSLELAGTEIHGISNASNSVPVL